MKLLIAGSRTITEYNLLLQALRSSNITIYTDTEIVSGGAFGVDTLAIMFAERNKLACKIFKPLYQHANDRSAPLRRNLEMAQYSDILVALWDGKSTGTKHMIESMKKLNKVVFVYKI